MQMQKNNPIEEKQKVMRDEVATLKQTYKSYREKLTWVEDTFEEGIIEEKMQHYASKIKTLNKEIAALEDQPKEA
jgi:flagellar biosynthesis chaperone FliJ